MPLPHQSNQTYKYVHTYTELDYSINSRVRQTLYKLLYFRRNVSGNHSNWTVYWTLQLLTSYSGLELNKRNSITCEGYWNTLHICQYVGSTCKTPWLKQEQPLLTELTHIYPGISVSVVFLQWIHCHTLHFILQEKKNAMHVKSLAKYTGRMKHSNCCYSNVLLEPLATFTVGICLSKFYHDSSSLF